MGAPNAGKADRLRPGKIVGISVFWFGLSFLTDGLTNLVVPYDLARSVGPQSRATVLGLVTFVGLLLAMLIQPLAGAFSDRMRGRYGRQPMIGVGVMMILASLAVYKADLGLVAVIAGYLAIAATASVAQAGQQGFIPDMVLAERRGLASGFKGLMDVGGATGAFLILGGLLDTQGSGSAVAVIAVTLLATYGLSLMLVREPSLTHLQRRQSMRICTFRLGFQSAPAFKRIVVSRFLFLLGVYMVGRFWLFFVADRLDIRADQAATQAGALLGVLALITFVAGPPAGLVADRVGRLAVVVGGSVLTTVGTLMLIPAKSQWQLLVFGALMALGTVAFTSANWAMTADVVPRDEAGRLFALANFGTAGAAAVAGLFGPLIDAANRVEPGRGYLVLLLGSSAACLAGGLVTLPLKEDSRAYKP